MSGVRRDLVPRRRTCETSCCWSRSMPRRHLRRLRPPPSIA